MFQLVIEPFGSFLRYNVFNAVTGDGFSLAPAAGANLLDLRFNGAPVIDGHQTPEELASGKWGKSAVLFPFPNRLDHGKYTWDGQEYTFPINNEATQNAIHGFVRHEAFTVTRVLLEPERASVTCRYAYDGHLPFYPFPFDLVLVFEIETRGLFKLTTSCKNQHNRPIPVGFGWHPYFKLAPTAGEHQLSLPECDKVVINERMIPTGPLEPYDNFRQGGPVEDTVLDNCFATAHPDKAYRLVLEGGNRKLTVAAHARQFPFFQVFTPPHRESIALEPMTCNVDAFNNADGLVILHPGETWKTDVKISID